MQLGGPGDARRRLAVRPALACTALPPAPLWPAPLRVYSAARWCGFSPYRSTSRRVHSAAVTSGQPVSSAVSSGAYAEANQEATAQSYAAVCA